MNRLFIGLITLSVLTACATGGSNVSKNDLPEIEIVSPPEFLALLDDLDARLDQGDPRQLNDIEQRRFDRIVSSLRSELAGVENMSELDSDTQLDLFNSTEELVATVMGRPEDQIICRRSHKVGTNFPETTCKTIAEFREEQDEARRRIREFIDTRRPQGVGAAAGIGID